MTIHRGICKIDPTVVFEGYDIDLQDVEIGPFCYLRGPLVMIGTKVYPHVVIGSDPEHKSAPPAGFVRIGASTIREFCAIQRGTGDRGTTIGDGCFIMDRTHVAHDVVIGDDVTISPGVVLGGHTRVHRGATIGINASTHQKTTIGAYSMIGMGSVVTKDVPPFALVYGNPARWARKNDQGVVRYGVDSPQHAVFYEFDCDRRSGREVLEEK